MPRGKKYIFSISAFGYVPAFLDVDLSTLGNREYSFQLRPVYLSPVLHKLDEVVVTASRVKFYNRGDTLVYNADAFKLAEGNMLDVLIRQLPGVELKDDGNIYVNGKFVETLLLNGKDFFDNNKQLMLNNLAAYMIKNVEVYNKLGQRFTDTKFLEFLVQFFYLLPNILFHERQSLNCYFSQNYSDFILRQKETTYF